MATKNELKAVLDAAGVAYKAKASLDTLQALVDELPKVQLSDEDKRQIADEKAHREAGEPGAPEGWQVAETDTPDSPPHPVTPAPAQTTGLKIEKDREERNGIKRPSLGGKCRAIWDALDEYVNDPENEGAQPDAKLVKMLAEENGWNPNNASIEYYQWRKFNGIVGRR